MSTVDLLIDRVCNGILLPCRIVFWVVSLPFQAIAWIFGLFVSTDTEADACPRFRDIPEVAETSEIDAAWPPAPHPVDSLPVQALIRANGKLIRDICYATTLSEEEAQTYLLPVITNLARIVHLTPASEWDHHQGYGGAFTHALEVAYYAANDAKTTIFDRSATPKELHQNKRRWIFVAVLAALAHDIGKPFTDISITAPNGEHWPQNEPILDWLRSRRIRSYYIAFRPQREHNEHKSAALAKVSMLIPKLTFEFLGSSGYGEEMEREFRNAILMGKEGGLIGRILDNADGQSRCVDMLRQRRIRPEFKNVAHPQGDQALRAIRQLIALGRWTTNQDEKSRVFVTKQGCFLVWNAEVASEIRNQALSMGFESLPGDYQKLATILVDAGAAVRNYDEISNVRTSFWRMTPIVLGNVKLDCIRLADSLLIFDGTAPVAMEAIVEGLRIDEDTKIAWQQQCGYLPVERLSREEEVAMGYTADYIDNLISEEQEKAASEQEAMELERAYFNIPANVMSASQLKELDPLEAAMLGVELKDGEEKPGEQQDKNELKEQKEQKEQKIGQELDRSLDSAGTDSEAPSELEGNRGIGAGSRGEATSPSSEPSSFFSSSTPSAPLGDPQSSKPDAAGQNGSWAGAFASSFANEEDVEFVEPQPLATSERDASDASDAPAACIDPSNEASFGADLEATLLKAVARAADDSTDVQNNEQANEQSCDRAVDPRRSELRNDNAAIENSAPAFSVPDSEEATADSESIPIIAGNGIPGDLTRFTGKSSEETERKADRKASRKNTNTFNLSVLMAETEETKETKAAAFTTEMTETADEEGAASENQDLHQDDQDEGTTSGTTTPTDPGEPAARSFNLGAIFGEPPRAQESMKEPMTTNVVKSGESEEAHQITIITPIAPITTPSAAAVSVSETEQREEEISANPGAKRTADAVYVDAVKMGPVDTAEAVEAVDEVEAQDGEVDKPVMVFFDEPLEADGTPVRLRPKTARDGGKENTPRETMSDAAQAASTTKRRSARTGGSSSSGNLKPARTRARSRDRDLRESINRDAKVAGDMLAQMLVQLQDGFGNWITDGLSTDLATGRPSTSSIPFETAMRESGIDLTLVELAVDEQEGFPRVAWDIKAHRFSLVVC